jgi:lactam utilization protein B
VASGAHPSLPDLMGFGRLEMAIAPAEFTDLICMHSYTPNSPEIARAIRDYVESLS